MDHRQVHLRGGLDDGENEYLPAEIDRGMVLLIGHRGVEGAVLLSAPAPSHDTSTQRLSIDDDSFWSRISAC
jgi:hypothetical protein